jgi:ferritin
MDQAIVDKNHVSKHELEWFVNEQREEITSATTLVQMVKRAGEGGMFFVETFLKDGGLAEAGSAGGEGEGE